MATLACRVQFLDDTDPFNSTNFPEPSRPPLFTFREDLALGTQLAGVHRLLRAPHKVQPGGRRGVRGAGWAPWAQLLLQGAPGSGPRGRAELGAAGGPAPKGRPPLSPLGRGVRARAGWLGIARAGEEDRPAFRPRAGAGKAEQVRRRPEAGCRRFPAPRR